MGGGMDHRKEVKEVVGLGYEALKRRMQDLFDWIADSNCT
jgi:hypothetical protein